MENNELMNTKYPERNFGDRKDEAPRWRTEQDFNERFPHVKQQAEPVQSGRQS